MASPLPESRPVPDSATGVRVDLVRSRSDRTAFRRLPFRLYASDPHWVPPLNRDVRAFLDPKAHPFYENGDIAFFLARRGREVVGRIAAIENRAHNDYHSDRTGFFGFFESENDPAVAGALLDTAAAWLEKRGLETIRGPFSPSTNYESGLLIEGDAGPPALMMPHGPSWYPDLLEAWGLEKRMDLLAYYLHKEGTDLERWGRISSKVLKRNGATIRRIDMSRFPEEVDLITEIYHDAWSENWGFVPLSRAEIRHMAKELKMAVVPWLTCFVEIEGKAVAFYLGLPDFNRVQIDLKGRLFPTGLFRILRFRKNPGFMRLLLMGVRKEFQHLGLDAPLYIESCRDCFANGVFACEASWILETNAPMIHALERAGGRAYRRYRIFERALDA